MTHIPPEKRREKGFDFTFTKLTDTSKATIFSVLVLSLAVGAALLIRFLGISSDPVIFSIWSCTPTLATLIMLLVVTRDSYSCRGCADAVERALRAQPHVTDVRLGSKAPTTFGKGESFSVGP